MKTKKKQMKARIRELEAENKALKDENEELRKRFRTLGSHPGLFGYRVGKKYRIETETGPMLVSPNIYGKYKQFNEDTLKERIDDYIEIAKRELITELAEGLIDQDIVQIIVKQKEDYPFGGTATIGAKLYVIPWEQTIQDKMLVEGWTPI